MLLPWRRGYNIDADLRRMTLGALLNLYCLFVPPTFEELNPSFDFEIRTKNEGHGTIPQP